MADSPEQMLEQTYSHYRNEAGSIADPYARKVSGVLKTVELALDGAASARQSVADVAALLKTGEIAPNKATAIRASVESTAGQVQEWIEAALTATKRLAAQIESDAFPALVPRAAPIADAKADIRLLLDALPESDILAEYAKLYERAWQLGDHFTVQVLTSEWGRIYLTARLGAGIAADEAWKAFRSQAVQIAAKYAVGADKQAFEALGKLDVLQKAITTGAHLAKMRLEDATQEPVGGSYGPAA